MASNPTLNTQTPAAPHDQKFGWGDTDNTVDRSFHQRAKNFIWRGIKILRFIGNGGTPDFQIDTSYNLGDQNAIILNTTLNWHLNGQRFVIQDPVNYPLAHTPGQINFTLNGYTDHVAQSAFTQTHDEIRLDLQDSSQNNAITEVVTSPISFSVQYSDQGVNLKSLVINKNGFFLQDSTSVPTNNTQVWGMVDKDTKQMGFVEGVQSGSVPYKVASASVNQAVGGTLLDYTVGSTGVYQICIMVSGDFRSGAFKITTAFSPTNFPTPLSKDICPVGQTTASLTTSDFFIYPAFTIFALASTHITITGTFSAAGSAYIARMQIYKLFETT